MRICLIFDGDYPWDIRVEKFAMALVEGGYEVHIISRNIARRLVYERQGKIHIHRLPIFASSRVNKMISFPAFFNPIWIIKIRQVIKLFNVNLVIVRDLPLALPGAFVGRLYGIPVLFDMAENYPDMLRDIWASDSFRLSNAFVRNPRLAEIIEMIALRTVSHTIVVVDESKQRLVNLGAKESDVSVIGNLPVLWDGAISETTRRTSEKEQTPSLKLVYVGGLEPLRGLDVLLKEFPEIVKRNPAITFTIVGDGRWRQSLQDLVEGLSLDKHVTFTGRLSHDQALIKVRESDVGIIPHRVTPFTNTTIPNKLFDYMMLGKPVLASNITPIRRIIEAAQCGHCYNDSRDLIEALGSLLDPATRRRLGENGRRAVLSQYNWKRESEHLLEIINTLLQKGRLDAPAQGDPGPKRG
jgi:glycosyltransferase involved in cell wall biosynthesis